MKNRLKNVVIFILVIALLGVLVACNDSNSNGNGSHGNGIYDKPYICDIAEEEVLEDGEISTIGQLAWLRNRVNEGERFSNKTFTLANDISLNGKEWIPIGVYTGTIKQMIEAFEPETELELPNYFAGEFDGNGKKITDFKITHRYTYAGFFGRNAGTIKDLTLEGVNVNIGVDHGKGGARQEFHQNENMVMVWAGGLTGQNYGTIDKCTVKGSVKVSVKNVGEHSFALAGGIVGVNWKHGIIKNSTSHINAEAISDMESASGSFGGGSYGKIESSRATGNAQSKAFSHAYAGGFIARNHGRVETCQAEGNATATTESLSGITQNFAFAGGLIAGSWANSTVENSRAFGKAEANASCDILGNIETLAGAYAYAGGIIGVLQGKIIKSDSFGTAIAVSTTLASAGGVVGQLETWKAEMLGTQIIDCEGGVSFTATAPFAYEGEMFGRHIIEYYI
ncbi:MAG: hypothetical protein FWD49_04865 [Firmicutes bacterium]|nr:hypothetical protein [Bacillota bacterium]